MFSFQRYNILRLQLAENAVYFVMAQGRNVLNISDFCFEIIVKDPPPAWQPVIFTCPQNNKHLRSCATNNFNFTPVLGSVMVFYKKISRVYGSVTNNEFWIGFIDSFLYIHS
jgi:hypothetical protein